MGAYSKVAVRAVELVGDGAAAPEAWSMAAHEMFPEKHWMRVKGCPRGAFLGLCEEGMVLGVVPGGYTRSRENKAYAVRAAALLAAKPELANLRPRELFKHVLAGRPKEHNSQMDVVLGLHNHGLLAAR